MVQWISESRLVESGWPLYKDFDLNTKSGPPLSCISPFCLDSVNEITERTWAMTASVQTLSFDLNVNESSFPLECYQYICGELIQCVQTRICAIKLELLQCHL